MTRAGIFLGIIVALSGCASRPVVQEKIVRVSVPVLVKSVKPEQLPAVPAPLGRRPADASQALDLALAKVCELYGYMVVADPLLRISAGVTARPVPVYPECD
jgi:hypothetical protein